MDRTNNEFEMNNQNTLEVDDLCSELEKLLNNKDYEHYYYVYIATHKLLDSARLLAKYSKDFIKQGETSILDPALQKNELVGSNASLDIDKLKANYNEVLNYIDSILKVLDKKKSDLCIAVLLSFESYIIDTGFIKRDTMNTLNEFADTYYEEKSNY